jgi:hypothetical protein
MMKVMEGRWGGGSKRPERWSLYEELVGQHDTLGRVDKRDSHVGLIVIQAGICDGDQLGTRPDVGRGMGVPW